MFDILNLTNSVLLMKSLMSVLLTQYKQLQSFFNKINELPRVRSTTEDTQKTLFVIDEAFKLFNIQVGQKVDKYNKLLNAEKNEFVSR